jgi:hypothetical protein
MEDHRFDELTRSLAKPVSRRQVLKALAAATLGGLLVRQGTGRALADNSDCAHFCNDVFPPGGERGHCKSGGAHGTGPCFACGPEAPSGHPDVCGVGTSAAGCCPATATTCCPAGGACGPACPPTSTAHCANLESDVCNCGTCGRCCPSGTICCGGTCIATCTASDQCHVAGVCDPATQSCTNPPKPDNVTCSGTDQCFRTYTCQAGVCTGSDPVTCTAVDQCHRPGTCDPNTGVCSNPIQPDGTTCAGSNACQTYACRAGVCTGINVADGTSCGPGLVCCSGTCTDTSSDANNCGSCGTVCSTRCAGGTCCLPSGSPTTSLALCCSGDTTSGGVCCDRTGSTCLSDSTCCSHTCQGGTCCEPPGNFCTTNADCCSHTCQGGTCQ